MPTGFQIFTAFLLLQLFYAFAVTLIVPALPGALDNQVIAYTNSSGLISYSTLSSDVEGTVQNQFNIPLLDFGALIFYSSSFLLNLMVNFITAVPQIMLMGLTALFVFFPFTTGLQADIRMILTLMLTLFYFISLISFVTGFRSGGAIG